MDDPQKPRFVIVDGSSYLYRAYNALPDLTNRQGEPTGAIYGVINMLRKLHTDLQPAYLAMVFDAKGKTFRHELFADYKAQRKPMPDRLRPQLEPLQAIITAMGWPQLQMTGVEADDVLATLAVQAEAAGLHTWIVTGDKDLAQLVNGNITLLDTVRNLTLTPEGVLQKFGVKPEQMVDYLALIGDKSDNIPGVPKVGEKTAAKWLKTYGSIAGLVQHSAEIPGVIGDNLRAWIPRLALSQQLVTLQKTVDLPLKPLDCVRGSVDIDGLRQHFQRCDFNSWLRALTPPPETQSLKTETPAPEANFDHYQPILTPAALQSWLTTQLQPAKLIALHTEASSDDPMTAELSGIAFAVQAGTGIYIPLGHETRHEILSQLKPLLENPTLLKVGHRLKAIYTLLHQQGIHLAGIAFDVGLESYLLDSTHRHDLASLAQSYLQYQTLDYTTLAGKGKNQLAFTALPLASATRYAAEQADIALRLHQALWPQLAATPQATLFTELEIPLLTILARMEQHGVLLDIEALRQHSQLLGQQLAVLETQAYQLAGVEFNLESPKQVGEVLFERMQLPMLKKTPKSKPSTAEAVLSKLAQTYPLPRLILEYRSLSKLKSTYTDALVRQVDGQQRVHPSYQQTVAITGRLACSHPNLQNIPIRTAEGRRIRQAFIAAPGYCLIAADYSQIELRIMAHLSGDSGLIAAFQQGDDVHRATAAEIFGVELNAVTHEQRRSAKAINFGLIYGMSAFGLAQQLDIPHYAAEHYRDIYFQRYPQVQAFMQQTQQEATHNGFVTTLQGRRLYLPDIQSSNAQRRQAAERAAINAPMQGTAADIIKYAMLAVQDWLDSTPVDARMIMQVHDELVFEVAEADVAVCSSAIRRCMAGVVTLAVPLVVDIGVGNNWDEAH